jgi:hypothetical protein
VGRLATRKPGFRSVGQSTRTLTLNASKEQHDDRLDSYRCEREITSAGEKKLLPEYSAAVIGSSVVLRLFAGGFTALSFALTTVPFATPDDARAWVEANRTDMAYKSQLPNGR